MKQPIYLIHSDEYKNRIFDHPFQHKEDALTMNQVRPSIKVEF